MKKYLLGFDVGGTDIKSCITNSDGKILREHKERVLTKDGRAVIMNQIKNITAKLLDEVYGSLEDVEGIGIGVPGPVNTKTGIVSKLMHIPGFDNYPLGEELTKLIGAPVKVGNDANLAALGELHFGSGKNFDDIIFITIGTGIGGGIIVNGKLVTGKEGAAGEIGCMKIGNSGKYCACGQFDCWHAYCSSAALVREAKVRLCLNKDNLVWEKCEKNFKKLEAKHIFDAAKEDDYFAKQLVDYEVKYLAKGIGSLINVFDPEAIILGGGLVKYVAGTFIYLKTPKL